MIVTQHIENPHEQPLIFWLEPWAEEYIIPVGGRLTIAFEGPESDPIFDASQSEDQLTFGCNRGGATYSVSINGEAANPY